MAFYMKPGQGPKMKTGNGLPSNLMGGPKMKSCGPMMTTPSTTPLYKKEDEGYGKLAAGDGVRKTKKTKAELTKKQKSFIKDPTGGVTKVEPKKSKITGKIGSDLRRQQYKDAGYAMDDTTKKKKVKATNVKPRGPKPEDIVKSGKDIGKEKKDVKPTVAPKITSKVVTPKKEVKKTRSQKIRAKGEAALASGNKKKALRLRRRMERVEAREKRRADRKAKK